MNTPGPSWVVTADDRTGAIECAAACADAGWRVHAVPWTPAGQVPKTVGECVVVDLRSRHTDPVEAQRRMTAVVAGRNARHAHKIDSALRGNWAEELSVLADAGRRVVLIPAHPAVHRIARGGVVLVDGTPVSETEHGADTRHPVRTSRVSDRLAGDELGGPGALEQWLSGTGAVAIVDAATLRDIDVLVRIAVRDERVVVAGPAPVIGAVAALAVDQGGHRPLPAPLLPEPVVTACASMHAVARAQMEALERSGAHAVMAPAAVQDDPELIAADVARRTHALVETIDARSVVLVGGDTADAFLDECVVEVFGSVDVSMAVGEAVVGGRRLRVLTKPGSFGTPNTLVDLMNHQADRTNR